MGKQTEKKPQLAEKRLRSHIFSRWDELESSFREALAASLDKAREQPFAPRYLYIQFLRTGVVNRLPWYRIDWYDEDKWACKWEAWAYFDVSPVAGVIYERFPLRKERHERIEQDMEAEKSWLRCAGLLHGEMVKVVRLLLRDVDAELPEGVDVYVGEYAGYCRKVNLEAKEDAE